MDFGEEAGKSGLHGCFTGGGSKPTLVDSPMRFGKLNQRSPELVCVLKVRSNHMFNFGTSFSRCYFQLCRVYLNYLYKF